MPQHLRKEKEEIRNTEKEKVRDMEKEMNNLTKEYNDIFQGIGKYRGEPVRIQLTDHVSPII